MDGEAADIRISGITPIEVARYAESIGILGIGVYSWGVHIDTRTSKYFWYDGGQSNVSTFGKPTYVPPKAENKEETKPTVEISKPTEGTINDKTMWDYFKSQGLNDYGVAGLMGNLYAESGFKPTNLQNTYEKSLGMTDIEYTNAVDNGIYTNFIKDSAGYGLAQWTYWSLKQDLLNYAKNKNKSIGDGAMQMEFLAHQLSTSYTSVWNTLKNATSILEASNAMLLKFERPADQSVNAQNKRASFGKVYYDKYSANSVTTTPVTQTSSNLAVGSSGESVKQLQEALLKLGFDCGKADGIFGSKTKTQVIKFQQKYNLKDDGIAGPLTLAKIEELKNNTSSVTTKVKVTASLLNIRSGPSIKHEIIGRLPRQAIVEIKGKAGDWAILTTGGYICSDYIQEVK
jgi:hypothetical protein